MIRNLGELGITLQKIVTRLTSNQNLLKLLYYTDKDPLSNEDLTSEQIKNEVFEKLIRIIPRVGPKETAHSIVSLRVDSGIGNTDNTEFRDFVVILEVFVPLTQWIIKNESLRPFCILGEIQKSLNNKNINGLGVFHGGDFELNFLTDEIASYAMTFRLTAYD